MGHKHLHPTKDAKQPMAHSQHGMGHVNHGSNPKHGKMGHDHSAMIQDFKRRFYVSLILTIPILILSDMIQLWFGFQLEFVGRKYLLLLLSTVMFWYGGKLS